MERLQKILSQAGVASRREAEKMILAGRVSVNGQKVTEMGSQADIEKDRITVDGKKITVSENKAYYLFHKPKNVIVTRYDPEDRPTVFDYLKDVPERVNPAGRLDFDSEGLLLLTNDGELLARLIHPRHQIPKIYHVKVKDIFPEEDLKKLEQGILIGDYTTQPCHAKILKKDKYNTWIEVILKEGKNRQIRRMVEAIDHEVLSLIRVGIGPLRLEDLPKGMWRKLTRSEIENLKRLSLADQD